MLRHHTQSIIGNYNRMNKIYIIATLFLFSCSSESSDQNEVTELNHHELTEVQEEESFEEIGPQYTPNGDFTPGIFTDSGYVNSYFNFQIIVGSEWEILDRIEQKRMLDVTKTELSEKNAKFEHDFDASQANWFEILT